MMMNSENHVNDNGDIERKKKREKERERERERERRKARFISIYINVCKAIDYSVVDLYQTFETSKMNLSPSVPQKIMVRSCMHFI